ncbi:MAG: hypothetical protein MZV64_67670 [Ignavibacteriales bacterium]|nr:hypothetical protein [Ignavibacteriales bacterium]
MKAKAEEHKQNLSALMITYPSTHGVFEESDNRDLLKSFTTVADRFIWMVQT